MQYNDIVNYSANLEILTAFSKGMPHLKRLLMGDRALCSISGGSDSDIMLDMVHFIDEKNVVDYVFFDTGLEYEATKKHLDYLEQKYNIEIRRLKPAKPIPICCRQYGVPFISKYVSEMISRLQRNNFKWEDEPYDVLIKKYPNCKIALRWWCNETKGTEKCPDSRFNINRNKWLKEFMVQNPPDFKISNKCCYYAKKKLAYDALKQGEYKLNIVGVRKAEGGIRATNYTSCFDSGRETNKNYDEWRPLFWFKNQDKEAYEGKCNIVHSECYTKYGLKRTGCVGCPFGRDFEKEIEIVKEYEPKLYKAINNVFGKSYEYMRKYREFKEQKSKEV